MSLAEGELLTLEPLIEAVRRGVEEAGWTLSGLQKTTSHEFEGRWKGDSTRSAYLFFHREPLEGVSVDVFLDETSRGLSGNLALVLDGPPYQDLGGAGAALEALSDVARRRLAASSRRPLTLRLRLADADADVAKAGTEARLKVRIPPAAIRAGASAVEALATTTTRAFTEALAEETVRGFLGD